MDVSAINQSTASAASQATSGKLAENFDTFLHLLVAQLQNQDPLQPTDTKEFVQQLVQFSQVEQQIGTNSSLDKLLQFQSTGQTAAAINYLGSTIEANGNSLIVFKEDHLHQRFLISLIILRVLPFLAAVFGIADITARSNGYPVVFIDKG